MRNDLIELLQELREDINNKKNLYNIDKELKKLHQTKIESIEYYISVLRLKPAGAIVELEMMVSRLESDLENMKRSDEPDYIYIRMIDKKMNHMKNLLSIIYGIYNLR